MLAVAVALATLAFIPASDAFHVSSPALSLSVRTAASSSLNPRQPMSLSSHPVRTLGLNQPGPSAQTGLLRMSSSLDRDESRSDFLKEEEKELTLKEKMVQLSKKIGWSLAASSVLFTMLASMLFFNSGLLGMGNLAALGGACLLIGPKKTGAWLLQRDKLRGTAIITLGIFLVIAKWAKLGIMVEIYGALNLFWNLTPFRKDGDKELAAEKN
mmetsp:Transcript_19932/g.31191  ORF Transcript_19932/g.31191 Transcript_19932/m.31191 type:complete len:213 (+) Transcript_19932:152-790(+)